MLRVALSPALASRCHVGNGKTPCSGPDSGTIPDATAAVPLISTADLARCTVARPQRSARHGRTLSPVAKRRRISLSRAGRQVMPPIPAGALPAGP